MVPNSCLLIEQSEYCQVAVEEALLVKVRYHHAK